MRLGLKRGEHWYAPIVRTMLCSEWSHGALEINGRIYESAARKGMQSRAGVRDYPLTPEIAAEYVWIDLGTGGEADALSAYALRQGNAYDWLSLLSFLPFVRVRDSACEYCYELVAIMLGHTVDSRITPEIILYHVIKNK